MILYSENLEQGTGINEYIAYEHGQYTIEVDDYKGIIQLTSQNYSNGAYASLNGSTITLDVDEMTDGATATFTIEDTNDTITFYITYSEDSGSGGGGGGTTPTYIHRISLEEDRISFSAKGNTNDSISIGYLVERAATGSNNWYEDDDPSGLNVSTTGSGYVTAYANHQNSGGWHGHIIITRTSQNYTNDNEDYSDSVSVQSITWSGASAEIDITITRVGYEYELRIDNGPSSKETGSSVSTSDFQVYGYKKSTLDNSFSKDGNTNLASSSSCSWNPSLPYTGNSAGTVSFTASHSTYGTSAAYSVTFTAPAEPDYITLDGESSYDESLGTGEASSAELSVDTNLSSWGVTPSTGASTVGQYGISVEKSGDSVIISGTSTYNGSEDVIGIWKVGNSSTYATVTITLEKYEAPVVNYDYKMELTPSTVTFENSDYTDKTVYFDIYRKVQGTNNWQEFDVDTVEATGYNTSYFSISVSNQSLGGHHGYATIHRLYTGTSAVNTTASFDSQGAGGAAAELDLYIELQPETEYEYQTVYVDIDDKTISATVTGSYTHSTSTAISTLYYTKQQRRIKNSGASWEDYGELISNTVNGYLDSAYSTSTTGTGSATATADCGTYGNKFFQVTFNITVNPTPVSYEYTLEVDPSSKTLSYGEQTRKANYTINVRRRPQGSSDDWEVFEDNTDYWDKCTYSPSLPYTNENTSGSTQTITLNITLSDSESNESYGNPTGSCTLYLLSGDTGEYRWIYDGNGIEGSTSCYTGDTLYTSTSYTFYYGTKQQYRADSGSAWSDTGSTSSSSTTGTLKSNFYASAQGTYYEDATTSLGDATLTITVSDPYIPPQTDTYSISASPLSVSLTTSNSYSATVYAQTYTNSLLTDWGSNVSASVPSQYQSMISVTKGSFVSESGTAFTVSKSSSYTTTGTHSASFTLSGHSQSATVSVSITIPPNPSEASIAFSQDNPTTINYGSYASLAYTKTPSSAIATHTILSGSDYVTIYNYYTNALRVYNKNNTYQNQTLSVRITNQSDTSKTDTANVTLYPKSFSVNIEYWYDNPRGYDALASGEITVSGGVNETFTLTLDNSTSGDGFTYAFRTGTYSNPTYITTITGNTGSSGSTSIYVYEYTKGENTEDYYGYATCTGVGYNGRTDYCTIRRRYISPSWNVTANPTQFSFTGGSVSFSCEAHGGNDYTNHYKVSSITDDNGMLSGLSVDDLNPYSATVLENTSVSSRQCTITFSNYDGDGGSSTIVLKQSGRNTINSLSISPATLTFSPTNLSSQEVTVISSDFSWSIGSYEMHDPEGETSSSDPWWECTPTSGVSGNKITVTTTQTSPYPEKTRSVVITINGGNGASTLLTIYQTGDERVMKIAGTNPPQSSSGTVDSSNFSGNIESWSYVYNNDSSQGELTINIYAEPNIGETSSIGVFNIISKFIGWDISCLENSAPSWISISPVEMLLTNEATSPVTITAEPWTTNVDASCYLTSRSARYILTSTIKSN